MLCQAASGRNWDMQLPRVIPHFPLQPKKKKKPDPRSTRFLLESRDEGLLLPSSKAFSSSSPTMGSFDIFFFSNNLKTVVQEAQVNSRALRNPRGENLKLAQGKPWLVLRVLNHSRLPNNQDFRGRFSRLHQTYNKIKVNVILYFILAVWGQQQDTKLYRREEDLHLSLSVAEQQHLPC